MNLINENSKHHNPVFVAMLNLPRATGRRNLMIAETKQAGLNVHFTPCFDWKENCEEAFDLYCQKHNAWGEFYSGHRATTISHCWAWKAFIDGDATHALIMEDDVYIAPETGEWINDLSWWPEDADIVKFESWVDPRVVVLLDQAGTTFNNRLIRRMYSRHMGAAGYMITRQAAIRLLAMIPFPMVIDHLLFNVNYSDFARTSNIYQIYPALIQQGNEPEDRTVFQSPKTKPSNLINRIGRKIVRGALEFNLPLRSWYSLVFFRSRLDHVEFVRDRCR